MTMIKSLPVVVKSCAEDKSEIIVKPNHHKFRIIMEEEYANEVASASCMETFINVTDWMEKYLTCYGLPKQVWYAFMVLFTTKPKEEITKYLTEAC